MRFVRFVAVATAAFALGVPGASFAQTPSQPDYGSGADDDAPLGEVETVEEPGDEEAEPPARKSASSDEDEEALSGAAEEERDTSETPPVVQEPASSTPPPPTAASDIAAHEPAAAHEPPAEESGGVVVGWNRTDEGEDYPWSLAVGGYLRVGYVAIQNDPGGTFGRHDGFVMGNARLSFDGEMRSLGFRLQIDGAVDQTQHANDPNAIVDTRLKDAYVAWRPIRYAHLWVGQFKPPFDIEEQISTAQLLFADRSVGSRGVTDIEGRNVSGLSVDRQVGAAVGSPGIFFLSEDNKPEGPGVSYGLAITNGQDANRALNDNDRLAGYGRLALHWADIVSVGGAYAVNSRTIGVEPDTIDEDVSAWTADLVVNVVGLTVIGSVMSESVARPDLDGVAPETSGFAYQAQIAYREPFLGFQPAIRYATFDPAERADASDELTYLTFGLNYVPPYPVRLLLNYTITQETDELALNNDRFDAVLQVLW